VGQEGEGGGERGRRRTPPSPTAVAAAAAAGGTSRGDRNVAARASGTKEQGVGEGGGVDGGRPRAQEASINF